jgi:uncharacterized protein (DUF2062 family)
MYFNSSHKRADVLIRKLSEYFRSLLSQGIDPRGIALGVASGTVLGVIPVLGVSTVLCALAAFVLRLNQAVIQVVNYAVYPLQLLFLSGYYVLGSLWFGADNILEPTAAFTALSGQDVWGGLTALKQYTLYAVAAWLLTSPLLFAGLYGSTRFIASQTSHKLRRAPAPGAEGTGGL